MQTYIKCMRLLTFLPLEEIDEMAKWEGSELNQAKESSGLRADRAGSRRRRSFQEAQEGARALFSGSGYFSYADN